jgi:phospholipase C
MERRLTRRQVIERTAAAGAAAGLAAVGLDPVIRRALAASPAAPLAPGSLADVEHVVILIQENRSFDHYFGTYRGVRGFGDRRGRAAFTQRGFPRKGFHGKLLPFHLRDAHNGCIDDITHAWGAQHESWNGGRMDRFVTTHLAEDGAAAGPLTMGYLTRADISFYHALADAFTICDGYHCSVLGPTDPNRLLSFAATLDPAGRHGGPLVETLVLDRLAHAGKLTMTTMPEQLSARGIEWKCYSAPQGGFLDNVLPYFKRMQTDPALKARGLTPTYPHDFQADARAGTLPAVSWLLGSIGASEHPGLSTARSGEALVRDVLATLTADPALWAKTALFVTWDENGGFFDHVAPPAPHRGTAGEFLTVKRLPAAAQGVRGPIGLGFRVPMLVISPYSRGGYVCSDTFDHTSLLRFLETRFGAEVPNLSAWRRRVTGDLTSAFSFGRPDGSLPRLPAIGSAPHGCDSTGAPAVPRNRMPRQEPGRPRRPVS